MNYREILERFAKRVGNIRAIVFCDFEGEAIDHLSELDSYHTQLFGAYQSDLLFAVKNAIKQREMGRLDSMALRTAAGSISVLPIASQYCLAVMCKIQLSLTHPAVAEVRRALEAEV